MIAFLIAGILHAGTVPVQVSASRQVAISEMKAMRKLRISVYGVSVCGGEGAHVPLGSVTAALAMRGIPVEFPEFVPLLIQRGREESLLGRVRGAGEIAGGLAALAATLAKAPPWVSIAGAGIGIVAHLAKGRQDAVIDIITPLAARLIRPSDQVITAPGICYTGLVLSSGDVPFAETTLLVIAPDATIRQSQWKPLPVAELGWVAE